MMNFITNYLGACLNTISLNGKWLFVEDAEQKLAYDDINVLLKEKKIKKEIDLPVNWELAGLHNFNGSVWFVKHIKNYSIKNDELSILKFFGVDYFSEVWINGIKAGSHEGYFQPFIFNISRLLINDENEIVVKVTSPREIPGDVWPLKKQLIKGIFNHHDCRPGAWSYEFGQDMNTGGIWNSIELYNHGKVFIEHLKIKPILIHEGTVARIHVTIKHRNSFVVETSGKLDVLVTLAGKKILKVKNDIYYSASQGEFCFTLDIDKPKLWYSWDLGPQNIYSLEIKSEYFGAIEENFGIKEVKLDENKNFFINGKKLFLRGTNIIPTQFLSDFTGEKISNMVSLIKEANINVVRVHAHVNRKELYEEFDKAGIIVWQDFALQWTYEGSDAFVTNAVWQIKDMVNLLHNHPSIAFWCCHNEPGEQIKTVDPFLYDAVISEDNTRIIRLASNYEEHPYDGWYWGNKEHYAAAPMGPLVTEFGAQALPGVDSLKKFLSPKAIKKYDWKEWEYHNFQYDQTFNIAKVNRGKNINEFVTNSQKYQSDVLQTAIDFYRRKKHNGITGVFQFMFIDCWPSITWAVVDFYGEKKSGYNTLKNAFEPVYLSVNLRQDTYLLSSKVNVDLYIINDLYKEFEGCVISFKLDDKIIGEVTDIEIKEDSLKFIHWESINIPFPAEVEEGDHVLQIDLLDHTKNFVMSGFEYKIKLVEKV